MLTPEQRVYRAKLAAEVSAGRADSDTAEAMRRAYYFSRARDAVRQVMDAAPDLTPDEQQEIAALIFQDAS